jgi:thiamine-monophosphate kinase
MGAVPTALLVGLGAPADLPVDWALGLADGLRDECEPLGVSVVGGDVVQSDLVVVAVTALGDLGGRPPVTRGGARPGDVVAICGRLGWAEAGLRVLSRGFRSPRVLVEAHRRPQVPYDAGPEAARLGATAMCDVSDGLLADLGHIATDSGVIIDLDRPALANACLDPAGTLQQVASALGADPMSWVLTGGEDHALVATFPPRVALPEGWTAVGAVRAVGRKKPGVWVNGESAESVVRSVGAEGAGHVHFG